MSGFAAHVLLLKYAYFLASGRGQWAGKLTTIYIYIYIYIYKITKYTIYIKNIKYELWKFDI